MKVQEIFKQGFEDERWHYWIGKICVGGIMVTNIEYHAPAGDGDAHYCDVAFDNGNIERIFRPDTISLKEE